MKILALDSAAEACSVAIWQDGHVSHSKYEAMARGHASVLVVMIEGLLQDAGLKIADFDGFAVTNGPGAFTGLRIALATARGFHVATKKPVIGITTLEALACAAQPKANGRVILCALDAKRADLYAQVFSSDLNPMSDAQAQLPENVVSLLPDDVKEVLISGDSFERLAPLLEQRGIYCENANLLTPDAVFIARLAAQKGLSDGKTKSMVPDAFYIRPPDAALPKNGGRLRP